MEDNKRNIQGEKLMENNGSHPPVNYSFETPEERKRREEEGIKNFGILGRISLLYALFFVFCLYKNFSGITNILWAAVTVFYMFHISRCLHKHWNNMNIFLSGAIVLLGVSNFTTGNNLIIFFNYVAMICLIATNLLFVFVDTERINVTKHILLLAQAAFGSISEWGTPFCEAGLFLKDYKQKKHGNSIYVFTGILIAIPLLIVIVNILASADEVFRGVVRSVTEVLSIDSIFSNIIGIGIMFLVGYVIPYAFCNYVKSGKIIARKGKNGDKEPMIAIIVTAAVSVVYVLFSFIQIVYLFLGNGTLPAGYSYAEYAREGFFQLLFISIFNGVLVLGCIEFFRENKVLKGILSIVSGCTFIMIASSAYRMNMYIEEYGLTTTRVLVLWALVLITILMIGLLCYIFKEQFPMFRYSVVAVTICFMILSFGHMDYVIAKYDLNLYEQIGKEQAYNEDWYSYVDYDYLMRLSTDAAPAIMEHKEEIFTYMQEKFIKLEDTEWAYPVCYGMDGEAYHTMTLRNFNLSRYIARKCVR